MSFSHYLLHCNNGYDRVPKNKTIITAKRRHRYDVIAVYENFSLDVRRDFSPSRKRLLSERNFSFLFFSFLFFFFFVIRWLSSSFIVIHFMKIINERKRGNESRVEISGVWEIKLEGRRSWFRRLRSLKCFSRQLRPARNFCSPLYMCVKCTYPSSYMHTGYQRKCCNIYIAQVVYITSIL